MKRTKKWINLILALGVIAGLGLSITARTLVNHHVQRWKIGPTARAQAMQAVAASPNAINAQG